MNFKSLKVTELKKFLEENGQNLKDYRYLKKEFLVEKCIKVQKGKDLLEMDYEFCSQCSQLTDNCKCERCKKCYEPMGDCECKPKVAPKPVVKPIAKYIKKVKPVKKTKIVKKIKPIIKPTINIKPDITTPPLPPQSSGIIDLTNILGDLSSEPVIEEKKDNIDKIQSLINLQGYKIKIKLFIIEKVNKEPNPGLKNDIIYLIDLILQKNKITLTEEQKQTFPSIFKIIYKESIKTQTDVLKEILDIIY